MLYTTILPTYNRCHRLAEAIESILQQSYKTMEIIVVDDGSTDDTAEMIAHQYPFVRYFYQKNQGPAAARNRGLREASGDLIALLDSDDIWLAHKIHTELSMLQHYPDLDALAGNANAYIGKSLRSNNTFAQRDIYFPDNYPRYFDWSMSIMQLGPVCCTSSMTFKKSALLALGENPFDESLRFDEDWDFEFRLFNQCQVLLYPDIVCTTRVFDDGTRHFYSPQGKIKGLDEQRSIWQQQKHIISRYLNNPAWDDTIKSNFQRRCQELDNLLHQRPTQQNYYHR